MIRRIGFATATAVLLLGAAAAARWGRPLHLAAGLTPVSTPAVIAAAQPLPVGVTPPQMAVRRPAPASPLTAAAPRRVHPPQPGPLAAAPALAPAIAAPLLPGSRPPANPSPTLAQVVTTVVLPVHDAAGRPVRGLKAAAFAVSDPTGAATFVVRKATLVNATERSEGAARLSVVLLLDQSGSLARTDPFDERLAGARQFLGALPDWVDAATVAFPTSGVFRPTGVFGPAFGGRGPGEPTFVLCKFTRDRDELTGSI